MTALALSILLVFLCKSSSTADLNRIDRRGHIENEKRVVGGYVAEEGAAQFLVPIVTQNTIICHGVLYNQMFVLTTQLCVHRLKPKDFVIWFGSNRVLGNWNKIRVKKIYRHPGFDDHTLSHDIAILSLNCIDIPSDEFGENVTLSDRSMRRGKLVNVFGFGKLKFNGENPAFLQTAQLTTISKKECRHKYEKSNYTIDRTMVCAAAVGKGACQGDNGGPLMLSESLNSGNLQPVLVGLYSFGFCSREGSPDVFTNIGYFHNWIEKKTAKLTRKCRKQKN